jgi:epoxyqueuosine reductase QueG
MAHASIPATGYVVDSSYPHDRLDAATLGEFLARAISTDPRNLLPEGEHLRIWEAPIVGVASGDDPLFAELKKPGIVGPIHLSPDEWLPGAKSVISYFMPYNKAIRKSYQIRSPLPSLEWASARRNGELCNNVLRRALIRLLEKHGGRGIAPSIEKHYQAVSMIPMWSERHAAFIAGVGTFGIHGGLITQQGVAGRIGSVITDIEIAPTPRPYAGVYDYCPYPDKGTCGACIPRCPVDAIATDGRDNQRCLHQGRDVVGDHFREWGYHSCGHCLTHLPCADRIPDADKLRPIRLLRRETTHA